MISILPALSIPNAILFSPHSRQISLEICVIYAIPNALVSNFICSNGIVEPIVVSKKLKIGLSNITMNEKIIITADSLEGIKNSLLALFIRTHKIAHAIPIAHIFILSLKAQTHPLFR